MKYRLQLLWAFEDGHRWIDLLLTSTKDDPMILKTIEVEKAKRTWGNYVFGLRVLKNDTILEEHFI